MCTWVWLGSVNAQQLLDSFCDMPFQLKHRL